jgi:pyruvate kinase
VADIPEPVREKADALMLSEESVVGLYSQKALEVLQGVSLCMERWC